MQQQMQIKQVVSGCAERTVLEVGKAEIGQQVEDVLQEQVDLVVDGQFALVHVAQVLRDTGQLPAETRQAVQLLGHVLRQCTRRRVLHFAAQTQDTDLCELI